MKSKKKFDFAGWVTKSGLKCTDGRTIKHGAFKDNDGAMVPLVWQHDHSGPANVLGNVLLEHRDGSTYGHALFNDTESGRNAKILVQHGDIKRLSIYANNLVQNGSIVHDGVIREVSLVYSGANPGAVIQDVNLEHSDNEDYGDEVIIHTGLEFTIEELETDLELEHADDPTVGDIFNSMTEEQQNVVYILISQAMDKASGDLEQSDEQGDGFVKHNAFEANNGRRKAVLTKEQFGEILAHAQKDGSFKNAFLAHAETYGIDDITIFFPDAQNINNTPDTISRDMAWVDKFMSGTKHTPFSRIQSQFVNITEPEARAKGYVTATLKIEEVITASQRETTPTTVYKKQKLDRDDIIDITSFDVVAFLKKEMRVMLNEEIARAALISDGRLIGDADKIKEDKIRPIYKDTDFFVHRVELAAADDTNDLIEACVRAREEYQGSGNPVMFTTPKILTDMLLVKDGVLRRIYPTKNDLMAALMVSDIIEVPVMKDVSRTDTVPDPDVVWNLIAIIVNPRDYTFGADKGGEISMFDDFDIDYNQMKYLLETRMSGALTKYKSAIVIEQEDAG